MIMVKRILTGLAFFVALWMSLVSNTVYSQVAKGHNLQFNSIPDNWDKGIPLGNGMLGALVWQKNGKLRISIDRADLWDIRPTKEIEKFTYQWAYEHKLSGDWDTVWKVADEPYDRDAAPTKIPGAAVEFEISNLGRVSSVSLDINSAICSIHWAKGMSFLICVDATRNLIWYRWEGVSVNPELIPPAYASANTEKAANEVVEGQDLRRLGYAKGTVLKKKNRLQYDQTCWGPLKYQAVAGWKANENSSYGIFSISSHYSDRPKATKAAALVKKALKETFDEGIAAHKQWWKQYWEKSSIRIPDPMLEKQWYLEMYKFGSASRNGSPPISLQAVWTADNGKLPPWKGDFHNDLNTQLSYWPAYSSNHLEEAAVFTDWLWENKPYFESYAKRVFGTDGINVPGVATLRGKEMGGWHMYAMSPTVSCWLSQHFYWQWKYSQDRKFLEERAYPWIKGTATHIEQLMKLKNGTLSLPLSSSPEFNDGGIKAWFLQMTNFDRSLCLYTFAKAEELANELNLEADARHWEEISNQLPELLIDLSEGLTVAPDLPYHESHRHFSHLMAIYPLGLLDPEKESDLQTMQNSMRNLEKQGSDWWCGYSFSWQANLYAKMKEGENAARALSTFSSCFCSPNSFHLNGDQCKAGHSKFTYDPFTLEGNFAFASGLQEMLLQSNNRNILIFPAIPKDWADVSFTNLRAEGAFLVSAVRKNGRTEEVRITSEKGGIINLELPFKTYVIEIQEGAGVKTPGKDRITLRFEPNGSIVIKNGFE